METNFDGVPGSPCAPWPPAAPAADTHIPARSSLLPPAGPSSSAVCLLRRLSGFQCTQFPDEANPRDGIIVSLVLVAVSLPLKWIVCRLFELSNRPVALADRWLTWEPFGPWISAPILGDPPWEWGLRRAGARGGGGARRSSVDDEEDEEAGGGGWGGEESDGSGREGRGACCCGGPSVPAPVWKRALAKRGEHFQLHELALWGLAAGTLSLARGAWRWWCGGALPGRYDSARRSGAASRAATAPPSRAVSSRVPLRGAYSRRGSLTNPPSAEILNDPDRLEDYIRRMRRADKEQRRRQSKSTPVTPRGAGMESPEGSDGEGGGWPGGVGGAAPWRQLLTGLSTRLRQLGPAGRSDADLEEEEEGALVPAAALRGYKSGPRRAPQLLEQYEMGPPVRSKSAPRRIGAPRAPVAGDAARPPQPRAGDALRPARKTTTGVPVAATSSPERPAAEPQRSSLDGLPRVSGAPVLPPLRLPGAPPKSGASTPRGNHDGKYTPRGGAHTPVSARRSAASAAATTPRTTMRLASALVADAGDAAAAAVATVERAVRTSLATVVSTVGGGGGASGAKTPRGAVVGTPEQQRQLSRALTAGTTPRAGGAITPRSTLGGGMTPRARSVRALPASGAITPRSVGGGATPRTPAFHSSSSSLGRSVAARLSAATPRASRPPAGPLDAASLARDAVFRRTLRSGRRQLAMRLLSFLLVYVGWAIVVWITFTFGILMYRQLGEQAEVAFARDWGYGILIEVRTFLLSAGVFFGCCLSCASLCHKNEILT